MDKVVLDRVGLNELTFPEALKEGLLKIEGDADKVAELFSMLDQFESTFNIVTPAVRP